MNILIDTNVFMLAEDRSLRSDSLTDSAARVLQFASELGFRIVISDATRTDIHQATAENRKRRTGQLQKYMVLGPIPLDPTLASSAGFPKSMSSNDERDLHVLNTLSSGAADWLVTGDAKLRTRASAAGHEAKVFSITGALETLGALVDQPVASAVIDYVKAYKLNIRSPIFEGIREDYSDFDDWFRDKVVKEHRSAYVLGSPEAPEGVAILKSESDQPHSLKGKVLKVCTFKISEMYSSAGRGELLLSSVVEYARKNQFDRIYVEVFSHFEGLISFLNEFGFRRVPDLLTKRGEAVLVKELRPSIDASHILTASEYNMRFGPGAVRVDQAHIVPIQDQFHRLLFPEADNQFRLMPRTEPCGNLIRKAYLCHANTRKLSEGDVLVFLRTGTTITQATALGVVEESLASDDADEITQFVGERTVYSANQIVKLASRREVLAIRFRKDRLLVPPWSIHEMRSNQAVYGSVQSIQQVKETGIRWIRSRLGE